MNELVPIIAGRALALVAAERGPRHIVRRGKTPVLDPAEARQLSDERNRYLDEVDAELIGRAMSGGL